MPSFAFWKPSSTDESRSPLLSDDTLVENRSSAVPVSGRNFDLDPGNDDSGVFFFDEADFQPPSQPECTSEMHRPITEPMARSKIPCDVENSPLPFQMNPVMPSLGTVATEKDGAAATSAIPLQCLPVDLSQLEDPQATRPAQAALEKFTPTTHGRDSAVYLSEDETPRPKTQSSLLALSDKPICSRTPSHSLKRTPSTKPPSSLQHTDSNARRLRRPANLNLDAKTATDSSKPRSELEMRYDFIRNSKSQSKANLRSPTELLKERLNLSPKKHKHEERVRIFTPPKPVANGCLLPGPGGQMEAFTSTSVRARTEMGGRPAWWCKFDKLVVFDGVDVADNGECVFRTRTSKGLSIARRRGDQATIIIPMDCAHCQKMLNRSEWKYDMRVCKRSVCWDCKERCKWEWEEEQSISRRDGDVAGTRSEASRDRADSVLQDEQVRDEDLLRKVGIEQGRAKSPIEIVGGIEERLESGKMESCAVRNAGFDE
ncbi:Nn.00g107250.m01.CDS01 [Neocucurbitaria sp. VM-36]